MFVKKLILTGYILLKVRAKSKSKYFQNAEKFFKQQAPLILKGSTPFERQIEVYPLKGNVVIQHLFVQVTFNRKYFSFLRMQITKFGSMKMF